MGISNRLEWHGRYHSTISIDM